jgi:hypothetical protein
MEANEWHPGPFQQRPEGVPGQITLGYLVARPGTENLGIALDWVHFRPHPLPVLNERFHDEPGQPNRAATLLRFRLLEFESVLGLGQ